MGVHTRTVTFDGGLYWELHSILHDISTMSQGDGIWAYTHTRSRSMEVYIGSCISILSNQVVGYLNLVARIIASSILKLNEV